MIPRLVKVKICGINDRASLAAATEAGADWVGFVFFPPSPRFVTPAEAAALVGTASGGPARVGLFVDPRDEDIATVLGSLKLDVLQIHADPRRAASLRAQFGIPVWRAIGIETAADLPLPEPEIDGFLLDAKAPPGSALPGGNAGAFDWSVLRDWTPPGPWLLAGGLTAANVDAAIARSHTQAVDVSSGVERSRGVKDPERIHAFIAAARASVATEPAPS